MIDGGSGGMRERPTSRKRKAPRAWRLAQNSGFVTEGVNGGAQASDPYVPQAWVWSQYNGNLRQSESEGESAYQASWAAHLRDPYHNGFRVLGLAAGIMVVIGLTSLFTTSPTAHTKILATLSFPSPDIAGATWPVSTPASPTRDAAAGVRPPNHVESNGPVSGVENQLLSFLENRSSKRAAFDLDRISFDAGKATLPGSSHNQLEQTAKILNAFPTARAGIWVYSDDGRNKAQNARLSFERAVNVRAELVRLGVGSSRLALTRAAKASLLVAERTREARMHEGQGGHVWISIKKM